uniref:Uncharacterized protein n=1 Tax=Meloidogyne javanica TaxID=6303 RepID=A0A915LVM8_MELJA
MSTNNNNYLNKNQEFNTQGNFGRNIPEIHSPQSTSPLITLPGATKRKSSGGISNKMENFCFVDYEEESGPKPKQKRYEDKMSAKLDNIHLVEDIGQQKQNNKGKRQSTLTSSTSLEQISQPKIVEIVEWDSELLDEEASLPIIEEPKEEKNLELKKQINERGFFYFNEKLRQFIYEGNEKDFALLPKPKSKIIGNELILFVQPSISSLLFKNSSKPQIEEIKIDEKIGRNNNIVEMEEEVEDNFLDLKSSIQSKENYLKEGEDNFEEMDIG